MFLKKKIAAAIIITISLFFSSCNSTDEENNSIVSDDETIAIINHVKISLSDFQTRLNNFKQHYQNLLLQDGQRLVKINKIVIDSLIEEELINQEATRKGIKVSDEELESMIGEAISPYANNPGLQKVLANDNISAEEWKKRLKHYLMWQKLMSKEVVEKIPITKREIRSYYKKHAAQFTRNYAFRVQNITLATEDEAKVILGKLKRGARFRTLVRRHSISPDKVVDGDLGYIERGDLPPEMETAIFKLGFRKGKVRLSEIVRSQDGFHIFYLLKYRRRKQLSQRDATPQIKKILMDQKIEQFYTGWIEGLKKNAKIVVDSDMLSSEEGF